ncbi:MAG: 2OG-Fe(II) oxygenase [Enhydrobacter sp.]|nr:2OG-Fe(II) oxygenase [Enhydrobacter sp.]
MSIAPTADWQDGQRPLGCGESQDHRQATPMPPRYAAIAPGDPAPWFRQRSTSNPNYAFDTVAGRYVVMCFFGSAADPAAQAALGAVRQHRKLFDDVRACFFGVSVDPADAAQRRVQESLPGIRFFWDFDATVSRLYGAVPTDTQGGAKSVEMRRFWLVLDAALRVIALLPFAPDASDATAVFDLLRRLPPPGRAAGAGGELPVPVLWLPNVFELDLCQALVAAYERHGGEESGFMRDVDGKTKLVHDPLHKRRRDFTVEDETLIRVIQNRVLRRIKPQIQKVHQFEATRMERYLVACYRAEDGGHFRPHRDNTTKGTAHRRFAVSINLNEGFEGGDLSFPEFGPRAFRPPVGGAVVFSCSLLHTVSPVTKGHRYAFLPFLYDDAAAKIRAANQHFLGPGFEYTP